MLEHPFTFGGTRARRAARASFSVLARAPRERNRMFVVTIVVGAVCGLCAVAFHASISWATSTFMAPARTLTGSGQVWATVLTPALGALLAGIMLEYVVPAARGSGIPQVKLVYAVRTAGCGCAMPSANSS